MKIKGIIMAGGKGTRLKPLTHIINKHFVSIYNKPMIYYSLSVLIYSGIKDILIICNEGDQIYFDKILINIIKKNKIKISYQVQENTGGGIAEGLILAKSFIEQCDKFLFILGDNFFYGRLFPDLIKKYLKQKNKNSYIFLSNVSNPKDYGVAYFKKNKLTKIIEKPKNPNSNLIVTGLYLYNRNVLNILNKIKPSQRNELEITSVNNFLIKQKKLYYVNIGRGTVWFDLGTYEDIYNCTEFIRILEKRQGILISDL
jgi:glucose-1-phosphate thymidylyltransferase